MNECIQTSTSVNECCFTREQQAGRKEKTHATRRKKCVLVLEYYILYRNESIKVLPTPVDECSLTAILFHAAHETGRETHTTGLT